MCWGEAWWGGGEGTVWVGAAGWRRGWAWEGRALGGKGMFDASYEGLVCLGHTWETSWGFPLVTGTQHENQCCGSGWQSPPPAHQRARRCNRAAVEQAPRSC